MLIEGLTYTILKKSMDIDIEISEIEDHEKEPLENIVGQYSTLLFVRRKDEDIRTEDGPAYILTWKGRPLPFMYKRHVELAYAEEDEVVLSIDLPGKSAYSMLQHLIWEIQPSMSEDAEEVWDDMKEYFSPELTVHDGGKQLSLVK